MKKRLKSIRKKKAAKKNDWLKKDPLSPNGTIANVTPVTANAKTPVTTAAASTATTTAQQLGGIYAQQQQQQQLLQQQQLQQQQMQQQVTKPRWFPNAAGASPPKNRTNTIGMTIVFFASLFLVGVPFLVLFDLIQDSTMLLVILGIVFVIGLLLVFADRIDNIVTSTLFLGAVGGVNVGFALYRAATGNPSSAQLVLNRLETLMAGIFAAGVVRLIITNRKNNDRIVELSNETKQK
jgi:hypothetical protein